MFASKYYLYLHRDTTPRSITTQQKSLIYKNNIHYVSDKAKAKKKDSH